MALLKTLDREGVVAIELSSPSRPVVERLHEEGLVRWAGGEDPERHRRCVLSGRGVRLVRTAAIAAEV